MELLGRTVTFVAGLHGNEKASVRALRALDEEFILGNPAAHRLNMRFVDEDLNASFGKEGGSFETHRAKQILEQIPPEHLVIDFHTTSAPGVPFAILTGRAMLPLAARTGCAYAVLMTHNIKGGHALIDHRDGIAVEISGYDTDEAVEKAARVVTNLRSGTEFPITVFEVFDKITEPGTYKNFVEHPAGFYPVLVGEQAYDFIGLKARKLA